MIPITLQFIAVLVNMAYASKYYDQKRFKSSIISAAFAGFVLGSMIWSIILYLN